MHKLLIVAILLFSIAGKAQTRQPYGNAERARATAQRTDAGLHKPGVQLGYLATGTPTRQEFLDNLEVGLRASGFPDNKIISFTINIIRKDADETMPSETIKGVRVPQDIFRKYALDQCKAGDVIYFESIKVEESRDAFRYVQPIILRIK